MKNESKGTKNDPKVKYEETSERKEKKKEKICKKMKNKNKKYNKKMDEFPTERQREIGKKSER